MAEKLSEKRVEISIISVVVLLIVLVVVCVLVKRRRDSRLKMDNDNTVVRIQQRSLRGRKRVRVAEV